MAALSRERILETAIRLADEEGIESLTMRKLGQALGVEAMSLYYHVPSKAELVDAIVDVVVGEIELPPDDDDWRTAIRSYAIAAHDVFIRHPWACRLAMFPTTARPELMPMRMRMGGNFRRARSASQTRGRSRAVCTACAA